MLSDRVSLLLLLLCQANALPLASQLSEEDEKVTKCITEILADTLSKPSPVPATSECMKILREDERVLAMLHHHHLLTELEEVAHQENRKHRLGQASSHDPWEGKEDKMPEAMKTRASQPTQQSEAVSEKRREQDSEWKEKGQVTQEYEKTKNIAEKVKEENNGEALNEDEEAAKDVMAEDAGGEEKKKKRTSSETWSSKEYFGHVKNRASGEAKLREGLIREPEEGRFRLEEEEEDEASQEAPKKYYHHHHPGGYRSDHHREDLEEKGEKKRSRLPKRVAEKASDEETAQFEEEEKAKGMGLAGSQSHLQDEEEEEEEEGGDHRHHHKPSHLDLKKRPLQDEVDAKGGRHGHAKEEEGKEREERQNEMQELEKLEEIEQELKRAAEKLRELTRG